GSDKMDISVEKMETRTEYLDKMKAHSELIAASVSGVFILFGWLLEKGNFTTASIISFLAAFLIGGYAKAKEGIEDTIKNKQLNVEMLMIFAAIGSGII